MAYGGGTGVAKDIEVYAHYGHEGGVKTLRGVKAPASVQVARLGRSSRTARFGPPLVASWERLIPHRDGPV